MTIHQKLTTAMQDGFDLALNRFMNEQDESRQQVAIAAGTLDGEKFEVHIVLTMNTPDFLRNSSQQVSADAWLGELRQTKKANPGAILVNGEPTGDC